MGIESFPLSWPDGWKRTGARKKSKFKASFAWARDRLFAELKLLGCPDWKVILSSNIPLRRDGLPYSGQANPTDPGFAVYFRLKEKPMVLACDQYREATDNLYAIVKTIEALRGIQRWGASDMMERSFTGFSALPPGPSEQTQKHWWEILGYAGPNVTEDSLKNRYRKLAAIHHPDVGGTSALMAEINAAYKEGLRSI